MALAVSLLVFKTALAFTIVIFRLAFRNDFDPRGFEQFVLPWWLI